MDNHQNSQNRSLQMYGVGLLKFTDVTSGGKMEVLFKKGIGIPLIQNVIELYKNEILTKKKGNSIIPLEEFTIFLHFFEGDRAEIFAIIYMDKKESEMNYTQLYLLTKKINKLIDSHAPTEEINEFIIDAMEIPHCEGLIAIFIIGDSGSPYISKIDKEKSTISKSEVHIGGFISALFSFSREIIGQDSGAKLKEINFGNQIFYMITKGGVIFAYLVEEINPLLKRYMYLIADEFLHDYKDYLTNFTGDISPFRSFQSKITMYFNL